MEATFLGVMLLGAMPLDVMVPGVKSRGFTQTVVSAARGSDWIVEGLGLHMRGHGWTHHDVRGGLLLGAFGCFSAGEIERIIFTDPSMLYWE